ncbi:hypothetical protein EsH8_VI_000137 [Colletotrichum jinshuiense]
MHIGNLISMALLLALPLAQAQGQAAMRCHCPMAERKPGINSPIVSVMRPCPCIDALAIENDAAAEGITIKKLPKTDAAIIKRSSQGPKEQPFYPWNSAWPVPRNQV